MRAYKEDERLAELKAVRQEMSDLDRENGASARPAGTAIALCLIVWLVLFLFDLISGKSFTAPTAVALATFAGLCWGTYRENRERPFGLYALAAGAAALGFATAHFMGL